MSLGTRAANRLRDLYAHVCHRTRRLNAEREAYPRAMHNQATGALIEQLEPRIMLSGTPIEIPGMHMVDPDMENLRGQIVYLDFDGEEDVTYNGPVTVENIDVPAFAAPGDLAGQEQAVIDEIVMQLETTFDGSGVIFTTARPVPSQEYSTVYIGGGNDSFRHLGDFLGVAEQVDLGNAKRSDNAFVFSDMISGQIKSQGDLARSLRYIISHETGRLLGYAERDEPIAPGYEQVMADVNLSFVEVEVDGVRSTNTSDDFYPDQGDTIRIKAKFNHAYAWAQPDGGISMTLDYLDDSKAWITAAGWDGDGDWEYYHDTSIWHKNGYQITASDPMLEGYEANWWEGARTLQADVYVGSETSFDLLTRAWLGSSFLPGSGTLDQQGYANYKWDILPQAPDTTDPEKPGNPDLEATDDSGYRNYDNITNKDDLDFSWAEPYDASGIAGYWWGLNDDSPDNWKAGTGTSLRINDISEGTHTLYIESEDNAGNRNTSASSLTFTVDTTRPTIDWSSATSNQEQSPYNQEHISDTTPTLDWSGSDSGSGILEYEVLLEYDGGTNIQEITTTFSSYTTPVLARGEGYDWEVWATDKAGNRSSGTGESRFYVDSLPPNLAVLSVELDSSATTWVMGEGIDAKATVKNVGGEDADGCKVNYYLGTATNKEYRHIGEGILALGEVYPHNGMQPGEEEGDWIGSFLPGGGWTIPEDVSEGTYYIWAHATTTSNDSNSDNDWERSRAFTIEEPNYDPSTPGDLTSSQRTRQSARIDWEPAVDLNAQDVITYKVEYGKTNGFTSIWDWSLFDGWTTAEEGTRDTFAVLDGLDEDTAYSVRITASDGRGGSAREVYSSAFTTEPNRIPDVPENIRAGSIGMTSATISWDPSQDADGDTVSYEIQYQKDDLNPFWSSSFLVNDTSYVLDELDSDASYHVRVKAIDSIGGESGWESIDNPFSTLRPQVTALSFRSGSSLGASFLDQVRAGSQVYLRVDAIGMNGQDVAVEVWEDDGIGDDCVDTLLVTIGSDGYGTIAWDATWQGDDGDTPFNKYYLEYDVPWTTSNVYSGSPSDGHFGVLPPVDDVIRWTDELGEGSLVIQNFQSTEAIDPTIDTWVVIHGRNSSAETEEIVDIAEAVERETGQQVLTLDWSDKVDSTLGGEKWIEPIGAWAAILLSDYGFDGSTNLNLIGHSWGSYVADELAEAISGVNTIIGLDPAANDPTGWEYDPNDPGEIEFSVHSNFSWAFHSSDTLGSEYTPTTADYAFAVDIGEAFWDDHNQICDVFTYMISNPSGNVSGLFSLDNVLQGASVSMPWIPNQYDDDGDPGGFYEALITATDNGLAPFSITYIDEDTGFSKTVFEEYDLSFLEEEYLGKHEIVDLSGRAEQGIEYIPGFGWGTSSGSRIAGGELTTSGLSWWSEGVNGWVLEDEIVYEGAANFTPAGSATEYDVIHIGDVAYGGGYLYAPLDLDATGLGGEELVYAVRYQQESPGSSSWVVDGSWGFALPDEHNEVAGFDYYDDTLYMVKYVTSKDDDMWAKAEIRAYDLSTYAVETTVYVDIPYMNGLSIQEVDGNAFAHIAFGASSVDSDIAPVRVVDGVEGEGAIAVVPFAELLLYTDEDSPYELEGTDSYYTYYSSPHAEGLTFDGDGNLWVSRGVEVARLDNSDIEYRFPEVEVKRGSAPITDGVTDVGFGSIVQNVGAIASTISILNTGDADLVIGSVSLANNNGFQIIGQPDSRIAPGASTTFQISLLDASVGAKGADVQFATNDVDESSFSFHISGEVTAVASPEIAVSGNGWNMSDGDSSPETSDGTDFGSVTQGQAGIERTFTVYNTGSATLTLNLASLPTGFSVVETLDSSLAPGDSDDFTVRMDTATAGTKSGDISISTNDSNENPFNFSITGTVQDNEVSTLTYTIANDEVTITDCDTSYAGELIIPDTIEDLPVTSIGDYAFLGCDGLTSIAIPDSVTSIGYAALNGCDGLTSIAIPDSVTTIGEDAFYNCDGLTSVTIPDSVASIGEYAFGNCDGLTSVMIGAGVISLEGDSFADCSSLVSIDVDSSNSAYTSVGGVVFTKDMTTLVCCPAGRSVDYVIPDSVTSIGDEAFYSCEGLTSVTIPDSVTTIGYSAFSNCSALTSITIPDSVTSIGDWAFEGCGGLTSVTIGKGVTAIGEGTFYYCDGLTNVTFQGDAPSSFGTSVFDYAADGFTVYYYEGAAGFTTPTWQGYPTEMIPALDISILTYTVANGEVVITDCDQAATGALFIPATIEGLPVTSIGDYAFSSCSGLTSVTIGNSVTTIGERSFAYCDDLTSVTIPDSVISIGNYGFASCSSLTSVTIPDSVTSIGDNAFGWCPSLASIDVGSSNSVYTSVEGVLFTKDMTTLVCCPAGTTGPYVIPSSIITIGDSALRGCALTSITIPSSVTAIGSDAFHSAALTSVTIPDSVETIGEEAFAWCTGLTSVTLGNHVSQIGLASFYGCTSLTRITIPDSVTALDEEAFAGCDNLTAATFEGDAPGSLGADLFTGAAAGFMVYYYEGAEGFITPTWQGYPTEMLADISMLSYTIANGQVTITDCDTATVGEVIIPDSIKDLPVTAIGDFAFAWCDSLASITIPDSVTAIGNMAFMGCTDMTNLTLGNSVASIGEYAFENCDGLTSFAIPSSVTSIGEGAFYGCDVLTSIDVSPDSASYIAIAGVLFSKDQTVLVAYPAGKTGSYVILDGVISIETYSFVWCDGLTSVTIPDSVTSIGEKAFLGCEGLIIATFVGDAPTMGDLAFDNTAEGFTVFFYEGAAGFTTPTWQGYPTEMLADISMLSYTIANGEVTIDFCDRNYAGELVIPDTIDGLPVMTIGDSAFGNCTGLTSVTIPDSVTTIGDYAFGNCMGLTNVTIPDSVTFIGDGAFGGCDSLTSIVVDPSNANYSSADGVLFNKDRTTLIQCPGGKIGPYTISDSVTSIGNEAFVYCGGLTSVTIPDSVTTIGNEAFAYCGGLTSVTIGNSVTSMGDWAFYDCDRLMNVTIPDSVTTVGPGAFYDCDRLTNAVFEGDSPSSFGTDVFLNTADGFTIYYYTEATGFTSPSWNGYNTTALDNTPPVIESMASYPDVDIAGQTIVVWDVMDNISVDHVDYVCGGLSGTSTGGSVSLLIPEGDFTFSLTAYDLAGNSVSDSYSGSVAATAEVVQQTVDVDMGDGEESVGIVIDEDADGTPDVLIDPTTAEEFEIVHLTPTGITTTPDPVDPDAAEVIVDVDKTDGWIFVNIADPFAGQRELLTITTSDGRVINPDNWWIDDDGRICMLDDPAVTYELDFENPATIEGRHVFYNNSYFDGNDAGAGVGDDGAVVTDKTALLPGGTANASNYTNYSKGINGIIVDVADLAAASLSASDFAFTVGNSADPSSWSNAPAPTSITVRTGEGVNGSDRVTLTWADNAIEKQWLQVTVLSDANGGSLGLEADDVFYFGNAVGDDGQSDTATVDLSDVMGAMNNPHGSGDRAGITDAYDYDRNGLVDLTDVMAAMNNGTSSGTRLQLISAPLAPEPLNMTMGLPEVQASLQETQIPLDMASPMDFEAGLLRAPAWPTLSSVPSVTITPLQVSDLPVAIEGLPSLDIASQSPSLSATVSLAVASQSVSNAEIFVDPTVSLLPDLVREDWVA